MSGEKATWGGGSDLARLHRLLDKGRLATTTLTSTRDSVLPLQLPLHAMDDPARPFVGLTKGSSLCLLRTRDAETGASRKLLPDGRFAHAAWKDQRAARPPWILRANSWKGKEDKLRDAGNHTLSKPRSSVPLVRLPPLQPHNHRLVCRSFPPLFHICTRCILSDHDASFSLSCSATSASP